VSATAPYLYSKEELIEGYFAMFRELGRPPSIREINQDSRFPSYSTYLRRLGNKQTICQNLNLPLISPKLFATFCQECLMSRETCNLDPFNCAREASLYFQGPADEKTNPYSQEKGGEDR